MGDPRPFRFDGDRRGVLLVHGFTGTPFEMRPLGEALARKGYTVLGPRLEGHGPQGDLGATTWPDWLGSVERGFEELRERTDRLLVCGLSLGGLLSLELGRRQPEAVRAVVSLGAPLWLPPILMHSIRLLGRLDVTRRLVLPKLGGSDITDAAMRDKNPTGRRYPVRVLNSLVDCMEAVGRGLCEVRQPVLLAHGGRDRTAPLACMGAIAAKVSGPVERVPLPRSAHVVTLDVEREELFVAIERFCARHLAAPAA